MEGRGHDNRVSCEIVACFVVATPMTLAEIQVIPLSCNTIISGVTCPAKFNLCTPRVPLGRILSASMILLKIN